jgi:hypothetical protein
MGIGGRVIFVGALRALGSILDHTAQGRVTLGLETRALAPTRGELSEATTVLHFHTGATIGVAVDRRGMEGIERVFEITGERLGDLGVASLLETGARVFIVGHERTVDQLLFVLTDTLRPRPAVATHTFAPGLRRHIGITALPILLGRP